MVPLLFMGLIAELLTFLGLVYQGFWIAFAGATLAGTLAVVGGAIGLYLRRPEPRSSRGVAPPRKDPISQDPEI
jgi:hypothetical protein